MGRSVPKLRCAIYTRKSSEEGLEQEFNSLHAQREACGAYIASQRHEGWTTLTDLFDDGGFSGGTLERPALEQLLTDIKANKIDVVVVYKIDRLTRSLFDFAKIVEIFDAHDLMNLHKVLPKTVCCQRLMNRLLGVHRGGFWLIVTLESEDETQIRTTRHSLRQTCQRHPPGDAQALFG